MTSTELLVLLALADHADQDGICWPSQNRLSERCKMTRQTINRLLKGLEAKKLIRAERRKHETGADRSSAYALGGVTDDDTPCHPERHLGVTDDDTLNLHITKKKNQRAREASADRRPASRALRPRQTQHDMAREIRALADKMSLMHGETHER